MKIEIFYSMSCGKCRILENVVHTALEDLRMNVEVDKLLNPDQAIERGAMSQPALWIDNKLIVQGRVPLVSEMKEMILKAKDEQA
jgi:small redox-active disulfide protein 2